MGRGGRWVGMAAAMAWAAQGKARLLQLLNPKSSVQVIVTPSSGSGIDTGQSQHQAHPSLTSYSAYTFHNFTGIKGFIGWRF